MIEREFIKDKIKEIYDRLFSHFEENQDHRKITFTDFVGKDKESRIISFYPLLHLENQHKVWLEQPEHFEEIHIWLKHTYLNHNPDPIKLLAEELEAELQAELDKEQKKRLKKLGKEFKNPIGEE